MFDVFQNVLFGKKKSSGDTDKDKSGNDDFVIVGQAINDQASMRETDIMSVESQFPKARIPPRFENDILCEESPKKKAIGHPIMPLQGIPFVINSALSASSKLDQIWQSISQNLSNIVNSCPYDESYDFSLEKSVISEMSNK